MLRIPHTLHLSILLQRTTDPNMPSSVAPTLPRTPVSNTPDAPGAPPAALKSEALFEGASEVLIDHRGVMYRLRQTSLGKLILTK